jgi:hypothetical protein
MQFFFLDFEVLSLDVEPPGFLRVAQSLSGLNDTESSSLVVCAVMWNSSNKMGKSTSYCDFLDLLCCPKAIKKSFSLPMRLANFPTLLVL